MREPIKRLRNCEDDWHAFVKITEKFRGEQQVSHTVEVRHIALEMKRLGGRQEGMILTLEMDYLNCADHQCQEGDLSVALCQEGDLSVALQGKLPPWVPLLRGEATGNGMFEGLLRVVIT